MRYSKYLPRVALGKVFSQLLLLLVLSFSSEILWAGNEVLLEALPKRPPAIDPWQRARKSQTPSIEPKTEVSLPAAPVEETTAKQVQAKPIEKKKALKLSGRVQLMLRRYAIQPTSFNEELSETVSAFDIASARIQVAGEPINELEYKLSAEFAGSFRLKDAYLNYKFQPNKAEFRLGQFNYQFGAENSQSSRYYQFVEKAAISSTLKQSRDRGLSIRGDLMEKRLYYFVGVCNGEGTDSPEHNNNFDFISRLAGRLISSTSGKFDVWLGGSAATGTRDNFAGESVKIASESGSGAVYFKAELPAGESYQLQRYSLDAKLIYGPWHAQAEYMMGNYSIENTAYIKGGYVTAGYFLSGEQRTVRQGILKRQHVSQPFSSGGKGAWELAVRYSWYNVDNMFFTSDGLYEGWEAVDIEKYVNGGHSWSVALNWYPDSHSRVMLNWLQTTLNSSDSDGALISVNAEDALLMRLQLEF